MQLPSFMFGKETPGGVWYFFLVALAVKTPLPLICLWVVGLGSLLRPARRAEWPILACAVPPFVILAMSLTVHYKEGVRHILLVFPFMAVLAAHGWTLLWNSAGSRRFLAKAAAVALLSLQCVSSLMASHDYISYYNALAGHDPGSVYLTGCDLDCGQDVARLAEESRKRGISSLSIAIWSAADIHRMGLPKLELLQPYQPAKGWVAISIRSLRWGHVFHKRYPPGAFEWLDRYQPVQHVGKTIFLYWIPDDPKPAGATIAQ
jgi:hypothetical protein